MYFDVFNICNISYYIYKKLNNCSNVLLWNIFHNNNKLVNKVDYALKVWTRFNREYEIIYNSISNFRFLILTKCNIGDYFVHKFYSLNLKCIILVIDILCVINYLKKV